MNEDPLSLLSCLLEICACQLIAALLLHAQMLMNYESGSLKSFVTLSHSLAHVVAHTLVICSAKSISTCAETHTKVRLLFVPRYGSVATEIKERKTCRYCLHHRVTFMASIK